MPDDEIFNKLETELAPVSHLEMYLGLCLYGLVDVMCNPEEYPNADETIDGILFTADEYFSQWFDKYNDYIEPLLEKENEENQ